MSVWSRLVLGRGEAGVARRVVDEAELRGVLALRGVLRGDPRGARVAAVGVGGGLVADVQDVGLPALGLDQLEDEHPELGPAGPAGVALHLGQLVVLAEDAGLLGRGLLVDVVLRDDPAQPLDLLDVRILAAGAEDDEEGEGQKHGLHVGLRTGAEAPVWALVPLRWPTSDQNSGTAQRKSTLKDAKE